MPSALSVLALIVAALPEVSTLFAAGQTALTIVREQRDPTPEEQAQLDAALEAANAATPSA